MVPDSYPMLPDEGSVRQRRLLAGHELRHEAKRDRVGLLHDRHDVFHYAVLRLLVRLDGDAEARVAAALLEHQLFQTAQVGVLLLVLPDLPQELGVLRDGNHHHVRLRNFQVRVAVRKVDRRLLRRVELRRGHEEDEQQEGDVDHGGHVDPDADALELLRRHATWSLP
jgi:hypothetical protein